MGKHKKDYWEMVKESMEEEANASSFAPKKSLTMSEYAKELHNAKDSGGEESILEEDMFVSRKKAPMLSESETEYYGDDFENGDGGDNCGTDRQIFKQLTKGLAEKAKPSKPEKAPELELTEAEDSGESAKEKKPSSSIFPLTKAKEKSENLNLQEMENAILAAVPLVRHDGGLYYYNGRTYIALKSDMDLMELIRGQKISHSCFQTRGVRIFTDLHVYLKTDPHLIPYDYEERMRKCRNYVVLNNGVLNAKKLELKPFDKKWLTFHSINANWVETPNPRRFLRFLNDAAMGDYSIVRLTLEVIGYFLSSLNVAKKFFVIGTAPDSGKSTLALLMKYLIGEEFVVSITPNNLSDRFALGSTRGKIANFAMDIPAGKLNAAAVSKIKCITGGDPIVIEEKYQRSEVTVSNLRFLFGTNYPLTISGDEDAFWNRLVLIPFMRSTPQSEIEVDLLDQLIKEKDHIVSLCLKHLQTVIKNNYTFSPCPRGEAMKKTWRRAEFSTASVYYFWNSCVEVTGNESDTVYASELHGIYLKYCTDNELDPVQYTQMIEWISKNTDPEMCRKKRIHKTGTNPLAGFAGIRIVK